MPETEQLSIQLELCVADDVHEPDSVEVAEGVEVREADAEEVEEEVRE